MPPNPPLRKGDSGIFTPCLRDQGLDWTHPLTHPLPHWGRGQKVRGGRALASGLPAVGRHGGITFPSYMGLANEDRRSGSASKAAVRSRERNRIVIARDPLPALRTIEYRAGARGYLLFLDGMVP
jgi:hypothetical protein